MSPEEWLADRDYRSFGAPGTTATDILEGTSNLELRPVPGAKRKNVSNPETYKASVDKIDAAILSPQEWLAKERSQIQSPEEWLKTHRKEKAFHTKFKDYLVEGADVLASTPAFLAGAGAGLTAAVVHASDPTQPAGSHFGAANAVFDAIMEMGGNPVSKALIGAHMAHAPKQGEDLSAIGATFDWVGKKIEAGSELAGETATSLGASPKTAEEIKQATKFGLTTVGPPIAIKGAVGAAKGASKVLGKGINKAKDAIVKDAEQPKPVDPDYAESKIKSEESIPEVLTRKREREAIVERVTKQQEEQAAKTSQEAPQGVKEPEVTPTPTDAGGITEQAGEVAKKPPLAKTDKEGNVTLDEAAIEQDFKDGFKYIFDPDSPTGYQKQLVFEQLGLSKEEFVKLIPDVETYKTLIKAHEESHVRNNDPASYPRTADGKLDLTHQRAIDIEARATADALKELAKPKLEEVVLQNIHEFITSETNLHGTVLQGVTDILAKSANVILAKTREADIFAKTIEKAIPVTELRDKMTRAAEGQKDWDRLLKDADKAETLEGMHKAITKWEKQLPPEKDGVSGADRLERLKFVKERLEKIGSEEHAIGLLKTIEARIAAIGEQAKKLGLIEQLRTNYIPHVLDWSKSKLTPKERQTLLDKIANAPKDSKLVRDFTEQRKFKFLRELEKAVEGTGVVVLTDIAKVTLAYEKAMQTAIIHKAMFDYLKVNKAPDGKPWVLPDGPEAKAAKYVSFEGTGTQAIRELRVHPDLADSMNFLFRQKDPNIILRTLGGISHLTKALNTIGTLFHMKSLFEAGALTAPKLMLSEIGKEVMFKVFKQGEGSGARQSLEAFKNGGNEEMTNLYLEQGLTIAVEDVQRTIVAETGVFLDNMASKLLPNGKELQLVQHITDPLDRVVIQRLNKWTWEYAHAGQKLNVAFHLHQKMKLKNPEMPDTQIAKEVSHYVNTTFGGLNWLEVANSVNNKYLRAASLKMAGLAGRDYAQILLFAPDWTVSTLRAFTNALPKELAKPQNWEFRKGVAGIVNPKTANDLARRYAITTALTWATILNGINIMFSGQPIWENRDPTRIQFQDGTSMQAAKHSMEAMHWLMAPDKTLGNKLGFLPKSIFVGTTGIAYPSPDAPKLKDTSMVGRAKAIGTLALPFTASSAIQAPKGEGWKRALASTLGAPVYGISKEALAKSMSEGKKKAKEKRRQEAIEKRLK